MKDKFFRNEEGRLRIGRVILAALGGLVLAALFAFLFGWIVMLLWNWLMPEIFGLKTISYWQAWGLVVLAHILIKPGYGNGGSHGGGKHKRGESSKGRHEDACDPAETGDSGTADSSDRSE